MKKNVQWLDIFVFALLLLTGCKGSEQETQKKNGESEDVSSRLRKNNIIIFRMKLNKRV